MNHQINNGDHGKSKRVAEWEPTDFFGFAYKRSVGKYFEKFYCREARTCSKSWVRSGARGIFVWLKKNSVFAQ